MTKKKTKEKTLEAKKKREEKITEDERKRKEKKALSDQKVERPLEEKTEEKIEEEVEKRVEIKEEEKDKKEEKIIKPETGEEHVPLWAAKTDLGKLVASGAITSIDEILNSGKKIFESEIVDKLVPDLKSELLLIGGRKGKGGGIQRIPVRITTTMHRSGRRFTSNAFAIVGDENGLIGLGKASAVESRAAIEKAINKAKLNIMRIKRGCGSWECGCGEDHSIPYKTEGKSGSVKVVLMPAPKGLGLVADDASKKMLRLAGIKDIWMKTYGNTRMRLNLIAALFSALKNLYVYDR